MTWVSAAAGDGYAVDLVDARAELGHWLSNAITPAMATPPMMIASTVVTMPMITPTRAGVFLKPAFFD